MSRYKKAFHIHMQKARSCLLIFILYIKTVKSRQPVILLKFHVSNQEFAAYVFC